MTTELKVYRIEFTITGKETSQNTVELIETEKETPTGQLEDILATLKKRLSLNKLGLNDITMHSITKMR